MNTNAKIIWGSKPENYPIKFAIRANQRTLNKSIFEFNRCFDDRYFMQSLFCDSLFCDRGFDDRCFVIAVLNVDPVDSSVKPSFVPYMPQPEHANRSLFFTDIIIFALL